MKLEELERIADAATPGVWFVPRMNRTVYNEYNFIICECGPGVFPSGEQQRKDAVHIATFNPARVKRMIGLLREAKQLMRWAAYHEDQVFHREIARPLEDWESSLEQFEREGGGE